MSHGVVCSTPSEAWNRKLPPIGFSVDWSGTAMTISKFPESEYYLRMAIDPRGILEFVIKAYRNRIHDHNTLEALIRDFCQDSATSFDMGKVTSTELGGVVRISREFLTGRGLSRKKWLAAQVPSPDGGPYGLLVVFGVYVGPHNNARRVRIMEHPVLKGLMMSFQLANSR